MKRFCVPLLLCGAALAVCAQSADQAQSATDTQRGIAQARETIGRALDAEEAQCQARFSVNDCIDAVRARRRVATSELNRQEARLHDAQRQQRGAEQLQALESKAAEGSRRKEAAASQPVLTEQDRREEQAKKQREHTAGPKDAPKAPPVRSVDSIGSAQRAENQANHQKRLADLELRRAELAERLRTRKPDTPTLPVPP